MAKKEKIDALSPSEKIERSLITTYKYRIWRKFTKALKIYQLLQEGDHVCVCISGGKDSMLLGLLFRHLEKYSEFKFKVSYLVMNPGYNQVNFEKIKYNLKLLQIPATIVETDIFDIANYLDRKPCYMCAKMRRGALYRIAKDMGCNKIALGHHYDDVIDTTLMNLLNAGSFQTMLPKLHSDHYSGMEIIRPLYLVREQDIIDFKNLNGLEFIQCACRFTENVADEESDIKSQRLNTKKLIEYLMKNYSDMVEKNIFKAGSNVNLDMVLGYKKDGIEHNYLDDYEQKYEEMERIIKESGIEEKSIEKANREHRTLEKDESMNFIKEKENDHNSDR